MKHFYLLTLILCNIGICFGQQTKNVYFIGNSYTYYNNLPDLVKNMALSTNDILNYQATTPGGSSLQNHSNDTGVTNIINSNKWDYVVLQDQSQRPALHDSYTFPFAENLSTKIKNSSDCSKVMFYMTWGYKNGDQINCNAGVTYMCTYASMDDRLYSAYVRLAQENKGVVSPVGRVWRTIRQQYPQMELYDADQSHPSYLGSMAAAYTFYTMIFKKDPTLATFNGNLSSSDAAILKNIVKQVVYNQMDNWSYLEDNTMVDFNYTITDSPTVEFSNISSNTEEVFWDFGDGNTSNEVNPTHTYSEVGEFIITLQITKCGETYEVKKKVVIETLSIADFNSLEFSIFPNPTAEFIYVMTDEFLTFSAIDVSGKIQKIDAEFLVNHYKINVKHLPKGMYWLILNDGKTTNKMKFIKKE